MAINLFNTQIDYFVRCARFSSFLEASGKLGISQSALSIAIKKLEEDLGGVQLFERNQGGVKLTEKGKALLADLVQYGNQLNTQVAHTLGKSNEVAVRIGTAPHFGIHRLIPAMKKAKDLPVAQYYLMRSAQSIEGVRNEELDIAIASFSSHPKSFGYVRLYKEHMAIAGLKKRFAHIEKSKSLKDLEEEPWFHTPKPQHALDATFPVDKAGYVVTDLYGIREVLFGGLAIGEVHMSSFSADERRKLAVAPVEGHYQNTAYYLIHRKNLDATKKKVFEYLAAELVGYKL